ncbi:MAG: ribonuclease HI [Bacteroidia bacterium]|nr:ribonuclease HI [Bacteroidia bacterium]
MSGIVIYTDGSSRGNPGPGGFGAILISGSHRKEISQGYRLTTNNRMELMSVIAALELLKKPEQTVTIYSDSQYVVKAIEEGWLNNWLKTGFKGKKNKDLWLRYLKAANGHFIKFKWIKGHNNHPLNERCDELAVEAAQSNYLMIDEGFESEKE